jgi:hypothetical protein
MRLNRDMPSAPENYFLCSPVRLGRPVTLDELRKYAGTPVLFYVKSKQVINSISKVKIIDVINDARITIKIYVVESENIPGCGDFIKKGFIGECLFDAMSFYFVDDPMNLEGGRRRLRKSHRKSHRKHRKSHRKSHRKHRKSHRKSRRHHRKTRSYK